MEAFREKILRRVSDPWVSGPLSQIFQQQETDLARVLNAFYALLEEGSAGGFARFLLSQEDCGLPFPDFDSGGRVFLVSAPVEKLRLRAVALVGSVMVERVANILRSRRDNFDREK